MIGKLVQKLLHAVGYELVPHPVEDWVRSRHILQSVLKNLSINCVLDVGANQGQYGQLLRDAGYAGRIVSFEPVKSTFDLLAQTAARDNSWRTVHCALGAEESETEINVAEDSVFTSFLTPSAGSTGRFPHNRTERKEAVRIRRLDDMLAGCVDGIASPRIYLKLDTQGFDLEVIKGAERVLPGIVGLQTEVSFQAIYDNMSNVMDSLSACRARGFEVVDFMPVTRDQDGRCVIEMDCIMARRSGSRL